MLYTELVKRGCFLQGYKMILLKPDNSIFKFPGLVLCDLERKRGNKCAGNEKWSLIYSYYVK